MPDRITLECGGVTIYFNESDCPNWRIKKAHDGSYVGELSVDDDFVFDSAEIVEPLQGKGIATAVVRYLVENLGYQFFFARPTGHKSAEGYHLSTEGAAWASKLVQLKLARWRSD